MTTAAPISATGSGIAALSSASTPQADETADRFLKLLVAQIQNQDPLNPLDNAQVTTQMAQINTVSGIDKLNRTVAALGTQFASIQLMQGVALVGREVTVPGDGIVLDAQGAGRGGFELAAPAERVTVEVIDATGQVVGNLNLGATLGGRHSFDWQAPAGTSAAGADLRFRVAAISGTTAVAAAPLMRDRVEAVAAGADGLTLDLARAGRIAWADVRAFN